ncbi:LpxL/LpxP family acyltransferase [Parapedobacter indicus]|uniref:Predicted acyltransferase, LPLAT superfamily n=1 Tax=Parapedobacter indicus TaxID=1477437 RepID=A0A1I3FH97_9SPHI|nr:lipid A biosynthesis acyltransferase [Parapedobacter indicus]PPL03725.1 putative LPLAT superfamily acyltransferase [Parapedobacter indicus]SFI10584.1 Predicted acyltransferase, LPLAT superfamily [Parapedobacter indicus]
MAEWEGKSRGTVSGYRIFIFLIKYAGINVAYLLLVFVSFYYVIFSPRQTKAIYQYFRYRRRNNAIRSLVNTYRNYFVFGQTIIDKVAITAGLEHKYTYEFDGIDHIRQLAKDNSAGILISAHVGNFEVSQYFMGEFDKQIHLVTTDEEQRAIKSYLSSIMATPRTGFIVVKDDLSHVFAINQVIEQKEMICFTGDRFVGGSKTLMSKLFSQPALFPAGPFLISSRLSTPVLFVYVMRERNRHYHLYARKAVFNHRDAQSLLEAFTQSIEQILAKYPLQWFNYYDFWKA